MQKWQEGPLSSCVSEVLSGLETAKAGGEDGILEVGGVIWGGRTHSLKFQALSSEFAA